MDAHQRNQIVRRVRFIGLLGVLVLAAGCSPCLIKRSVRFEPAEGLRVIESLTATRLSRLPWSKDPVPQRYELIGPGYRIVFATPDGAVPMGLFIESATKGPDRVAVVGPRVHENEGAIGIRYYILADDEPVEPLEFEVRDQQGTVLGRHALRYRLVPYSYLCSFEGP